jgi:phospholipase C
VVKFIERNWGLKPLTGRSRDNLPNPVMSKSSPYVPVDAKGNPMAAVGDLFDMFNFKNNGDDQGEDNNQQ